MRFFAGVWCYTLCGSISLFLAVAVAFFGVKPYTWLVATYLVLGIATYLYLLHALAENVTPVRSSNGLLLIAAFAMTTGILVTFFAFGWGWFFAFGPSGGPRALSAVDSLYFSSAVFFTVGFGDFVPLDAPSKCYFAFQALIGSVHFVSFFALGAARVVGSHHLSSAMGNPAG